MENSSEKRKTSHIIPYLFKENIPYFFLQKRADDAERNPGKYSIFGGGIEQGENPEQVMIRESQEELGFNTQDYFFVCETTDNYSDSFYFAIEVADGFNPKISEGLYGKFLNKDEIINESKLSDNSKQVIEKLYEKIMIK